MTTSMENALLMLDSICWRPDEQLLNAITPGRFGAELYGTAKRNRAATASRILRALYLRGLCTTEWGGGVCRWGISSSGHEAAAELRAERHGAPA